MRHWNEHNNVSLEQLLAPDDELKLHQSDWSTMQVARALRSDPRRPVNERFPADYD